MKKHQKIKPGTKYNSLTIIKEVDFEKGNPRKVLCKCDCGKEKVIRWTSLRNEHTKSCGCLIVKTRKQTTGKKHPNFTGGKYITNKGYVILRKPNHLNSRVNGEIFEHRWVMSEHLGRALLPEENVHHINGVRNDNRLENLELWSSKQPKGQRVKDKLKWAKDIIELYKEFDNEN